MDCSKEFSSVKRLIHHRIIHTGMRNDRENEKTKTCLPLSLDHPLAFARLLRLVKGRVTTFEDRQWVNWIKGL